LPSLAPRAATREPGRPPAGAENGACWFADTYQGEECVMLRGPSPVAGLRVTGFVTAAARYCAITGGRYAVTGRSGAVNEQSVCSLPGGKACNADAYYAGACGR